MLLIAIGRPDLDAQVLRIAARFFRQALTHFFFEKLAEEIALEHRRVMTAGANADAHQIVGKQRFATGALDLLLHVVQHRDTDLRHLWRIADGLRHRPKRRLEYCTPESLNDLPDPHWWPPTNPKLAAVSTMARAIGAAVVPPEPPCSTTTAKAI